MKRPRRRSSGRRSPVGLVEMGGWVVRGKGFSFVRAWIDGVELDSF